MLSVVSANSTISPFKIKIGGWLFMQGGDGHSKSENSDCERGPRVGV
jgi:hypothetical protein